MSNNQQNFFNEDVQRLNQTIELLEQVVESANHCINNLQTVRDHLEGGEPLTNIERNIVNVCINDNDNSLEALENANENLEQVLDNENESSDESGESEEEEES